MSIDISGHWIVCPEGRMLDWYAEPTHRLAWNTDAGLAVVIDAWDSNPDVFTARPCCRAELSALSVARSLTSHQDRSIDGPNHG